MNFTFHAFQERGDLVSCNLKRRVSLTSAISRDTYPFGAHGTWNGSHKIG